MSEYPEHTKLRAIRDKSQAIGEFLHWLRNDKELRSFQDLGCETRGSGALCARNERVVTMMKRQRWTIHWDGRHRRWEAVPRGGGHTFTVGRETKLDFVRSMAARMWWNWQRGRVPSELIIKTKDGRVQERRAYGLGA